jgi:hypothetical protein
MNICLLNADGINPKQLWRGSIQNLLAKKPPKITPNANSTMSLKPDADLANFRWVAPSV